MSVPTIQPLPKLTAPENVMAWASRLIVEIWKRLFTLADTINKNKAPSYTTTLRDELDAENGMIIYNTTTNTMQGYINGSWTNM